MTPPPPPMPPTTSSWDRLRTGATLFRNASGLALAASAVVLGIDLQQVAIGVAIGWSVPRGYTIAVATVAFALLVSLGTAFFQPQPTITPPQQLQLLRPRLWAAAGWTAYLFTTCFLGVGYHLGLYEAIGFTTQPTHDAAAAAWATFWTAALALLPLLATHLALLRVPLPPPPRQPWPRTPPPQPPGQQPSLPYPPTHAAPGTVPPPHPTTWQQAPRPEDQNRP